MKSSKFENVTGALSSKDSEIHENLHCGDERNLHATNVVPFGKNISESYLHPFAYALCVESFVCEVRINIAKMLANQHPEDVAGKRVESRNWVWKSNHKLDIRKNQCMSNFFR